MWPWLKRPGKAWLAMALLLAAVSLPAWWVPASWLAWQPGRWMDQPWRAWTAVFVHWSPLHLGANAIGCLLVAALGAVAAVPPRAVLAWLLAWPLLHLGLLADPGLLHYGGLSGLLHAGVAVVGCWLTVHARGRRRGLGLALLAGLTLKLGLEGGGAQTLVQQPGWDVPLAPLAHTTGALAGAGVALVLVALRRAILPSAALRPPSV